MALTNRLGIVVDCRPECNQAKLEEAEEKLIQYIREQRILLIDQPKRKLIDIGSGSNGSPFVNRYAEEFPEVDVTDLDSDAETLVNLAEQGKKVLHADAAAIPLPDNSFDIVYTNLTKMGILRDNRCYEFAKEAHRILVPNGLFVFVYCGGNDSITERNLFRLGFEFPEHIQRIIWAQGMPDDTYTAAKAP